MHATMVKEFRNLGHITAFAVFVAVLVVFIPENLIARSKRDCTLRDDGSFDCGKDATLDHLRKGIDAQQMMLCTDLTGRYNHSVDTVYSQSDLEKHLSVCANAYHNTHTSSSATARATAATTCNKALHTAFSTNPYNAFNSKQRLDFNVYDMCDAPAYLGGPLIKALEDDTCESNGKTSS